MKKQSLGWQIRCALLVGVVASLPLAHAESVDQFPSKPITIVAQTAAGSSTDLFARELAQAASEVLGQPIVVTNRPGGSGAAQMAVISSSAPDGYTVGVNTASHITAMLTNLKGMYKPSDFSWITLNQIDPFVLVVNANSPYKTVNEMVKAGIDGEKIRIGGYGSIGSAHNIAVNIFAETAKMPFTWVGYPGSGDAITAVLGNHIEAASSNPGGALPFVEGKRAKILAIANEKRIPSLPDVPTYAEAGYDVDTSWKQIRGIYGPKGIPLEIQKKLADAFFKAMQSPRFMEYMERSALVVGDLGPDKYPQFIDKMSVVAGKWLTELGLDK